MSQRNHEIPGLSRDGNHVTHRNECDIEMMSVTQKWVSHRNDECHTEMMSFWFCHVTGIMWRTKMISVTQKWMRRRNDERHTEITTYRFCHVTGIMWRNNSCFFHRNGVFRNWAMPRRNESRDMAHFCVMSRDSFGVTWLMSRQNEPCDAKWVIPRRLSVGSPRINLTSPPSLGIKHLVYSSMHKAPCL